MRLRCWNCWREENNGVADVHGRIRIGHCSALQLEVLAMRRIGTVSWMDLTALFVAGVMLAIEVLQTLGGERNENTIDR